MTHFGSENEKGVTLGQIVNACLWGILFCVIYFLFLLVSGVLIEHTREFVETATWSDASLWMLILLYISIVSVLFFVYGYVISRRMPRKWPLQLIAVLSVSFLGALIWFLTYRSIEGATSDLGSFSWFIFTVFMFWATPIFEFLEHYITNSTTMKFIGLLFALLPSSLAFSGIISSSYLQRIDLKKQAKILFALPGLLGLLFVGSLLMPTSAPFTLDTYPKVDGATAAIPFGEILVNRLTGVNKPQAARSVQFNTTHEAYLNLINKRADIIFVAGPSDEEEKLAAENGVTFKLTPIGKDAFVFLTHQKNPVNQLTVAQLQDIYSGKVTNWQEVGGEDNKIIAFQREENSGSQTFMVKQVMKDIPLAEPPTVKKAGGMGGLIEAVADYQNAENAIGYSFYYYANEMNKREEIKFLAINGIEPNKDTILSNQYPYTAILYAVTREDEPADSPATRLLQWILSEEGGKAIEAGGYIPIKKE